MSRSLLALGLVALLSACGTQRDSPLSQALLNAVDRVSRSPSSATPQVVVVGGGTGLTRSMFDQVEGPLILVVAETRQQTATLRPIQTSQGNITWATQDGVTLVTRNGLLTATRGLGPDLISAAVTTIGMRSAQVTRTHYTLDAQQREKRQEFACQVTPVGPARIVILGETVATQHVTETC